MEKRLFIQSVGDTSQHNTAHTTSDSPALYPFIYLQHHTITSNYITSNHTIHTQFHFIQFYYVPQTTLILQTHQRKKTLLILRKRDGKTKLPKSKRSR